MPTKDPNIVCKITSDVTEAVFIAAALSLPEFPEGIVRYEAVYELPGAKHRNRPVFVLWREAAESTGVRYNYSGVDYETRSKKLLVRYLGLFKDAAGVARDALRASSEIDSLLTSAKSLETEAHNLISEIDLEHQSSLTSALTRFRGPLRVAAALRACEELATLMENTYLCDAVGGALSYYLDKGILLADVHQANVGTVSRLTAPVITDPGHAVGLEAKWRAVVVPELP